MQSVEMRGDLVRRLEESTAMTDWRAFQEDAYHIVSIENGRVKRQDYF
jgi:hypothetical protein